MKGIILAGGSGSRLHPLTNVVSKQLLPVFDKPMIYYSLSVLFLAEIKEIAIITTNEDKDKYFRLLGNGKKFGVRIEYFIQEKPRGIPEAFLICNDFIKASKVMLVLGDNIFYSHGLTPLILASKKNKGATIFSYEVVNPKDFGVVEIDAKNKIKSIEEKPIKPKSNLAITGLYIFDQEVSLFSEKLKISKRGELEIVDLLKIYLKKKKINHQRLWRGFCWLDTGTPSSLIEAGKFIEIIEKRQGLKVGCLEEIAYRKKFISQKDLKIIISELPKCEYRNYIEKIINEK